MTEFLNQLGPYQLHTEFQRGPIAHLYRATDTRDGQLVLVHLLAPTWTADPTLVAAFLAAGKAAQALQHTNIVPILACEIAEGQPYLVTPFISDQTLGQLLRRRAQRLDQRDVLAIVEAVAAALDAAHAQGIIHGGIGLDTIYITASRAILLDGFYTIPLPRARQLPLPDPAATVANEMNGEADGEANDNVNDEADGEAAAAMPPPEAASTTALAAPPLPRWPVSPFMAPEQARDESTLDRRTDVYSLGAITYTLLLGRLPFTATDRAELVRQIVDRLPPQPEAIEPTIATGVAYVLRSVLAKDPAIRYSSAGEFANALAQGSWLASVTPAGPSASGGTRPRPAQPARKRAAGVAVLLLLLTALALVLIIRDQTLRGRFLAMLPGAGDEANLPITIAGGANPAQQSTAAAIFTPEVMVGLTPVTATASTPTAIHLAQVATPLQLATVATTSVATTSVATTSVTTKTATNASSASVAVTPTLTMTARAGVKSSVTTTITATATSVLSAANDAVRVPQALRIDPLGLLEEGVAAGSIVIHGEAAPGTRLRIAIDDQPVGEALARSTGTWSIITTLAQLGDYTVVAEAIDSNDQVTDRATGALTVIAATPRTPVAAAIVAGAPLTETLTPTRRATATTAATLPRTATATPVPPTVIPAPTRTATVTKTALPTATLTAPPTATKKALPTATNTNTPAPTMTATQAPTATHTPRPTNTTAPTATHTAAPTATNTPRPTATNTRVPTATSTNTPLPTATNTPRPTATFTPIPPTATNTPLPTATQTNTPLPTATFTPVPPTATNTAVPTWTPAPTNTPTLTPTNTPIPSPTVASGQVTLVEPSDGTNGGGQRIFRWSANFTPSPGTGFELVFWRPGEDPMGNGFGLAAPTLETGVTVDLDALDDILGERLDNGDEYRWGILLVKTEPYERISYLGGGYTFLFSRSNGGGGNDGGPSSGE